MPTMPTFTLRYLSGHEILGGRLFFPWLLDDRCSVSSILYCWWYEICCELDCYFIRSTISLHRLFLMFVFDIPQFSYLLSMYQFDLSWWSLYFFHLRTLVFFKFWKIITIFIIASLYFLFSLFWECLLGMCYTFSLIFLCILVFPQYFLPQLCINWVYKFSDTIFISGSGIWSLQVFSLFFPLWFVLPWIL